LVALYGRQPVPIDCREAVMARLQEVPVPATSVWSSLGTIFSFPRPVVPVWARATALAGLAIASLSVSTQFATQVEDVNQPVAHQQLAQEEYARIRESSQLLQALGRDDGYILASDIVESSR
jgi:hypothetical protein